MNLIIIALIILLLLTLIIKYDKEGLELNEPKIAYITAIYGNYEVSCKPFVQQTIPTDFICFTDNENIINNGWIIDVTPYHYNNKSSIDNDTYINSLKNNSHTFNIAKYYKQNFYNIPILKKYDVIIWIDGSIEIINENTSNLIIKNINEYKIIGWEHEYRQGNLKNEVDASTDSRYTSTFWNNQSQPIQDVLGQYNTYIDNGYDENYFKNINNERSNLGVWVTCFIAFLNNDDIIKQFLDEWYLQTLKYSTQDQIGFSYVCQKQNIIPYTFPDNDVSGNVHSTTNLIVKHTHGK
jgi:hypothetical protein